MATNLSTPGRGTVPWGFIVAYNISFECNRDPRCKFCYNTIMAPQPHNTSLELAEIVADQLVENGTKIVSISGGEPLMNDKLLPILSILNNRGLHTNVITNGDLITEDIMIAIRDTGTRNISISISSEDDFIAAVPKLELLERLGFAVHVNSVLGKDNLSVFMDIFRKLTDFACFESCMKFNVFPHPTFIETDVSETDKDQIAVEMLQYQRDNPHLRVYLSERPRDYFALKPHIPELKLNNYWHGGIVRILPNGDIVQCAYGTVPIGNVRTHRIKELGTQRELHYKLATESCPHYPWVKNNHPEVLDEK